MSIEAVESTPATWERTTLGTVCDRGGGFVQTGPFGSQLHASDYVADGVPSIMPTNLGDWRVRPDGIARVAERDAERLGRHRVRAGDIVFSRRGDVERHGLVQDGQEGWLCGTGCLLVRPGNAADSTFLSLWLRHPDVRSWLVGRAVGSTMPNLNTTIMSEVPVALPPSDEQRAIAEVLGALDDKVELNRQMNHTLEEMASALFKSWFVDFDPIVAKADGRKPFGMDAATAALFPATLVDGVPSGWRPGLLGDVARNPRRGVSPQAVSPETPYIGLEHMPRRSLAIDSWGRADAAGSTKFQFRNGELLFGKLRPYFHKVGIAPVAGVCSTDILVVEPKRREYFGFVVGHCSSGDFVDYTDAGSGGTRMPRTSWEVMARYELVIPDPPAAAAYLNAVGPWFELMATNTHESRTLAALRDTLLPKLLSGEVRLKQAERLVEAAL